MTSKGLLSSLVKFHSVSNLFLSRFDCRVRRHPNFNNILLKRSIKSVCKVMASVAFDTVGIKEGNESKIDCIIKDDGHSRGETVGDVVHEDSKEDGFITDCLEDNGKGVESVNSINNDSCPAEAALSQVSVKEEQNDGVEETNDNGSANSDEVCFLI